MVEWGRLPSRGMITLYVCGRAGSKRSSGVSSVAMVAIAEQGGVFHFTGVLSISMSNHCICKLGIERCGK
eukprot:2867094-Alexandrium_andersonii.AAC.1